MDLCEEKNWDPASWGGISSFCFWAKDSEMAIVPSTAREGGNMARVLRDWLHPNWKEVKFEWMGKNPSCDDKSWSSNKFWLSIIWDAVLDISSLYVHGYGVEDQRQHQFGSFKRERKPFSSKSCVMFDASLG